MNVSKNREKKYLQREGERAKVKGVLKRQGEPQKRRE